MNKKSKFNFETNKWFTSNTYDNNYKNPPDKSGIYLIVLPKNNFLNYEILYVGSTKNLKVRYARHEVIRLLKEFYGYVQFYFKETENYREIERKLIKIIQPRYNKQWR